MSGKRRTESKERPSLKNPRLGHPAAGYCANRSSTELRIKTRFRPGMGKRETRLALLQLTTGGRGLGVNAKP